MCRVWKYTIRNRINRLIISAVNEGVLKTEFTLEQAVHAYRVRRGIFLLFL
jgi:hypothetical protein